MRRRLTVRSNPPGALVYVDDQEIGTTPVSTSFVYYGTRKIRLVRDGYETVTVLQRIRPPWYQHAPLDFFSENLVPWDFRDERVLDFELVPQRVVPTEELLGRAENLRQSTRSGYVAPLPAPVAPNSGVPIVPEASPTPATRGQILPLPPPPFGQPG